MTTLEDATDCQIVRFQLGDDRVADGDRAHLGLAIVIVTALCSAAFWIHVLF